MPSISTRGAAMPASPIRKLVPFAEAAVNRGVKIYHLNIGQPDIETPPQAMEALKNTHIDVLEYSHSAGFESLRKKIAGYYHTFGAPISFQDIIVTAGASEALFFGMSACLDPGDEIIVPEPFYANYNGFAMAGGLIVKPITANIDNNFALPPADEFELHIGPKTKAILICNPSNPTGYLYTAAELKKLGQLAVKHDLFLMVDEVYREFVYGNKQFTSVLTLEGLEDHVIVFDSISKRYSACGARIGCIVSRNATLMNSVMRFAQARLSPPSLGQIIAEALTEVEQEYIDKVIQRYEVRRNTLVSRLKKMKGVVCPDPGGAFYVFAQLPIDDCDNFCQWLLESFNHGGETVMMAPGSGFYASPGLGKQEVRMAYVLNNNDLNKAMDCLEVALIEYPGRTEIAS